MKTYHKDYGVTASITVRRDGTARITAKSQAGQKVHDRVHATRKAAEAAWRRMCG